MKVSQYEDYKYVMQDAGSLYLGARYSYQELLENETVPFKLKAILEHYIFKEASPETTLESQFYYMEQGNFLYETFHQLKVKIKVQLQVEKKGISGKTRLEYKEKVLSLKELCEINLARKRHQE